MLALVVDDSGPASATHQTFGVRLREMRKSRGLSLRDLARAMEVSSACVSHWENDKSKPRLGMLERLALLLQTSTLYLLTGQQLHPLVEHDPVGSRSISDLILRARQDVARAVGVDLSKVRIVIR